MTAEQRNQAYRDWYPAYLEELAEKRQLLHKDRRVSRGMYQQEYQDDIGLDLMTAIQTVNHSAILPVKPILEGVDNG